MTVCWMRRDLRLEDNHALWQALRSGCPVLLLFIFDTEILGALREKEDRRVAFIFSAIETMNRRLRQQYNSGVLCLQGKPEEIFEKLLADYQIGGGLLQRGLRTLCHHARPKGGTATCAKRGAVPTIQGPGNLP